MRLIAVPLALALLSACAKQENPSGPRVAESVITQVESASLQGGRLRSDIDSGAVRRLLAAVPASAREVVRSSFELVPGEMRDLTIQGDPVLEEMAAQVYKGHDSVAATPATARLQDAHERLHLWSRPILLALVRDSGSATGYVRISRSARWDYDVVLLGESTANASALDAGMRTLYRLRLRDGPPSDRVTEVDLRSNAFSNPERMDASRPRSWNTLLEGKLAAVRRAPLRNVPSLGRVRAIDFVVVDR